MRSGAESTDISGRRRSCGDGAARGLMTFASFSSVAPRGVLHAPWEAIFAIATMSPIEEAPGSDMAERAEPRAPPPCDVGGRRGVLSIFFWVHNALRHRCKVNAAAGGRGEERELDARAMCMCVVWPNGMRPLVSVLGPTMELAHDLRCFGHGKVIHSHVVYSMLCEKIVPNHVTPP